MESMEWEAPRGVHWERCARRMWMYVEGKKVSVAVWWSGGGLALQIIG
jgi:hypothetical protein